MAETIVLVVVTLLAVAGWAAAWLAFRAWRREASRKRSMATRHGQLNEQFAPWLAGWPFDDPGRFRFVGDPIDGVQFEDDAIYLVEIKTASSRLSTRQRSARDAVRAGRVGWVEFSASEGKAVRVERPWEQPGP